MDDDEIFGKMNFLNLNDKQQTNFFSNITQKFSFNDNQDDEENQIYVVNDDKTELSQIKELDNDSGSVTESAYNSRKESQINLRENINLTEEKKEEEEFLRPHDINFNKKNENNINNNFMNNNSSHNHNEIKMDFEDQVNKKYGLFPII